MNLYIQAFLVAWFVGTCPVACFVFMDTYSYNSRSLAEAVSYCFVWPVLVLVWVIRNACKVLHASLNIIVKAWREW